MDNIDKGTSLQYTDSEGTRHIIKGCELTLDNDGRYWLWSEQLKHNIAYKIKTQGDALMCAIDSLLFTIQLKDEQLKALNRINDLALQFANEIKPDTDDD